jgi:hypothetical protein
LLKRAPNDKLIAAFNKYLPDEVLAQKEAVGHEDYDYYDEEEEENPDGTK